MVIYIHIKVNNNLLDGCCFFEVVALHLKSKYSSSEYNWTALGDIKPLAPSLLALAVLTFVEWREVAAQILDPGQLAGDRSIKLDYIAHCPCYAAE